MRSRTVLPTFYSRSVSHFSTGTCGDDPGLFPSNTISRGAATRPAPQAIGAQERAAEKGRSVGRPSLWGLRGSGWKIRPENTGVGDFRAGVTSWLKWGVDIADMAI